MTNEIITGEAGLLQAKYREYLTSKLAAFRRDDVYCDVDIHVGEQVFKCHRLVLSSASSYFDRMFRGPFKEGSGKEITIREIEASVFDGVLKFMYTGNVKIDHFNICDMIKAADFYSLHILQQICIKFVKENLDELAEYILKIYSFVHCTNICNVELADVLSSHVCRHFRYFSGRPEYCKLTYDSLIEVLTHLKADTRRTQLPFAYDIFVEAIDVWISHQVFSTPAERNACIESLMDRINVIATNELPLEKSVYRTRKRTAEEETSSRYKKFRKALRNDDDEFLHAYVSRSNRQSFCGVSVFRAHRNENMRTGPNQFTWVHSGELRWSAGFMRNVRVGGDVYSLRCSEDCPEVQTFSVSPSVLMYPATTLKEPPFNLNTSVFDMCGAGNNIYVYVKNRPELRSYDRYPGFSREELCREVFVYKRDINQWFPLPSPAQTRVCDACMTCDDEGFVYLIGGQDSTKSWGVLSKSAVRVYDPRTEKWSSLPSTRYEYVHSACCAYGKKLYVVGGINNPRVVETYENGNWSRLTNLPESIRGSFRLANWCPQFGGGNEILLYKENVYIDSKILRLDSSPNKDWDRMPNLYKAVKNANNLTFDHLKLLDVVLPAQLQIF